MGYDLFHPKPIDSSVVEEANDAMNSNFKPLNHDLNVKKQPSKCNPKIYKHLDEFNHIQYECHIPKSEL